jgi:DNA polymerase-4
MTDRRDTLDLVRRILHVDMDAFYASVEQRDDPTLRGKPVAVGGERRGVICAASYEARAFGVRSAMPTARARRLCRELIVVHPNFEKYHQVSQQVFAIFAEATPLVEGLSLDEAFLDVTENRWGLPLGRAVAQRIKERIRADTGLTASAGVAPNKFLAKIASGWKKPDGLTVIAPERVERFLRDLPVGALWGVGPVTEKKLRAIGVAKVVDLRSVERRALRGAVGSFGDFLVDLAHGVDERPVVPHRERRSVGSESTFPEDLVDPERIRGEVDALAREVARWLAEHERGARTVTLKVRYSNSTREGKFFETITRSDTRDPPERSADAVAARAVALLARTEAGSRPIRLLGVSLHDLEAGDEDPPDRHGQLLLPFPGLAESRARAESSSHDAT